MRSLDISIHRLDEVLEVIAGNAWDASRFNYQSAGVPVIRIQNLGQSSGAKVAHWEHAYDPRFLVSPGDILLSLSGSFKVESWMGPSSLLNQRIMKMVPNPKLVQPEYAKYLLQSRLAEIESAATKTAVKNTSMTFIRSMPVRLPPLLEQQRIVERIKECMERIDEIEKLSETSAPEVKALSRSFYREQYERLCADHKACRLDQAAKFMGGGTPSKQNSSFWTGSIPWISPKDMKRRDLHDATDHISDAAIGGSSAKLISESSVLFVVRGMILAHTLPIAINRVPVAINQDMKAAVPSEGFDVDFLATMLRGAEKTLLAEVEIAGHGTCRLQQPHWSGVPIPVLSPVEQADVVAATQAFESIADRLSSEVTLNERGAMRAAVLHNAFAGEM